MIARAIALLALIPAALSAAGQPTTPAPAPPPASAPTPAQPFAATFEKAAVAADHAQASAAGLEILRAGGNAVDAAAATSFALSVVRSYSCGIGGGGFMVIHLRNHPRAGNLDTTVNYREQAPAAMGPDYFEKLDAAGGDSSSSTHGGHAALVPGTVAGLLYALEKYGTGMDRRAILAPAIRLAEEGFTVDANYIESVAEVLEWINKDPIPRSKRFPFLWDRMLKQGMVKVGDVIKLPEQAAALRLIAERGPDGFYRGPVADAIVAAVKADGGCLTHQDLAGFKVAEAPPLVTHFRGRTIVTMPPPSSGGLVIAQVLALLDLRAEELAKDPLNSTPYLHLVAEASKHAFADRARWLGDPAFVQIPLDKLLAPDYIKDLSTRIDLAHTLAPARYGSSPAPQLPPDHGTSHFCVVDESGSAVACTETINLIFGSLLAVERFGFILNDQADDFLTRRGQPNAFKLQQSDRNLPAPGKRPLSSMTPVIAFDPAQDGRVVLIAGGSGGPRIISSTLQVSLNVLLHDLSAETALTAPRFHHQWEPDTLQLEPPLHDGPVAAALRSLGHVIAQRNAIGTVQVIRAAKGRPTGYEAASDPRKGGLPAGY